MAKILSDRSSQLSDRQDQRNLKFSILAITSERVEIFFDFKIDFESSHRDGSNDTTFEGLRRVFKISIFNEKKTY